MIEQILDTSFGDANLDGVFNSQDLVMVFQAGEYEDSTERNSTWESGDWNGDGEFDSADIILAFQRGQYVSAATSLQTVANRLAATTIQHRERNR